MDIIHRIESLSHFIKRLQRGETPARLVWPVLVVDEEGNVVTREERERILRALGVERELSREPDVYEWADRWK